MFKRASNHYGETPPPETPYMRAHQLWDERIGAARLMRAATISGVSTSLVDRSITPRMIVFPRRVSRTDVSSLDCAVSIETC